MRSLANRSIDKGLESLAFDLIVEVAKPGNETEITGGVQAALRKALGETFQNEVNINGKFVDGAMYVKKTSVQLLRGSSRFLLFLLFEHKVGNGEGIKQLCADYANAVLTAEEPQSRVCVPRHKTPVPVWFTYPVLAMIIEEQTLKFEALHLDPGGIVSEPLGCCNLRLGVTACSLQECAMLLTAARRCIKKLELLNKRVLAGSLKSCIKSVEGSKKCAVPDLKSLLPAVAADFKPGFRMHPVVLRQYSQVFCLTSLGPFELGQLQFKASAGKSLCKNPAELERRRNVWERLAQHNLAPMLHSMKSVPPWTVVVAEWLNGNWIALGEVLGSFLHAADKATLRAAVLSAVERMHGLGIVHGDLRAMNIKVQKGTWTDGACSWDVRFIDLDWAGNEGEAMYPWNLNNHVPRAEGAVAGGVILASHDTEQVEIEFNIDWTPLARATKLSRKRKRSRI
jgi:hypothetical protein